MAGSVSCEKDCTCGKHKYGPEHHRWIEGSNRRKYFNHDKIRRKRGIAGNWCCTDCSNPAREWSQRHGTVGDDVMDYDPRCTKCHAAYDAPRNGNPSEAKRLQYIKVGKASAARRKSKCDCTSMFWCKKHR